LSCEFCEALAPPAWSFATKGISRVTNLGQSWSNASTFIFDVEGTLVDAVMPTLHCWRETLEAFGHTVTLSELHRYSGMDGQDMLEKLMPDVSPERIKQIIERQGERYREKYLPLVQPLPGAHQVFAELKRLGRRLGLATTCQNDELEHYLKITDIRGLIDGIACGDDVERGKPHPALIELALQRLNVLPETTTMVGDTPYDAMAARAAGTAAVGLLTGHFAAAELKAGGVQAVFRDPADLSAAVIGAFPRSFAPAPGS
jgi:HAD superfamily hydrolase (TIGR01549 family)